MMVEPSTQQQSDLSSPPARRRLHGSASDTASARDVGLVMAISLAAFALSIMFDFYERFADWNRAYEDWEIDEFPVLFLVLSIGCAWLAYRRVRALRAETTAHQQTDAALQESEQRYRSLVEGSIQGIWIQKDGRIQFANRALAEIFGYDSPEDLVGEEVWRLVAPHERTRLAAFGPVWPPDEQLPSRLIWQGRCKDDHPIWVESLASSLVGNAAPVLLVTALDVTDRMRQEQEQQRIAYEIHDGIAQLMVSAQQHLETCIDLWQRQGPLVEHSLAKGVDCLDQAIVETRRLMARLRPVLLDTLGLISAVRHYVLEELRPETGWDVEFVADVHNLRLLPDWETAIFRIIQEALTNARKHADTPRVSVVLRQEGAQGDMLSVVIRDWGRGFEPTQLPPDPQHLGILGMRERARTLGGTCTIESRPGQGTTVIVRMPPSQGAAS